MWLQTDARHPFCDGAHTNLPGGSPLDDPQSRSEPRGTGGERARWYARALLNGELLRVLSGLASMNTRGSLRYCYMVSGEFGALYQTQLFLEVTGEASPVMTLGDRDVILFVGAGGGSVNISGRSFPITATDGVYVRPSEAMQLTAAPGQTLRVFVLACPLGEIAWLERMPVNFDAGCAQRVVSVDAEQRTAMGPRYYQVLVDKRIGSNVITQFIGHIPTSGTPHRHLYEEAIIILSGEGYMWTEDRKARVRAGM